MKIKTMTKQIRLLKQVISEIIKNDSSHWTQFSASKFQQNILNAVEKYIVNAKNVALNKPLTVDADPATGNAAQVAHSMRGAQNKEMTARFVIKHIMKIAAKKGGLNASIENIDAIVDKACQQFINSGGKNDEALRNLPLMVEIPAQQNKNSPTQRVSRQNYDPDATRVD